MPTREELIQSLSKDKYTVSEVKHLIKGVKKDRPNQPTKLKKGDILSLNLFGKCRPVIVVKEIKNYCIVIPMSSTEDSLNIHSFNSRFYGEGYFNMQLLTLKLEHMQDKFIGVLDDNKNLNIAIKKLRQYYNNII